MSFISHNNHKLLSKVAYFLLRVVTGWSLDALIKSQSDKVKFLGATGNAISLINN
jgi:hypothetical protein